MDTKTGTEIVPGRNKSLRRALLAFGSALLALGAAAQPAAAVESPSQQWMTAAGGGVSNPGDTMNVTFGGTGVTGLITGVSNTNTLACAPLASCMAQPASGLNDPTNLLSGANVATYIEPDQPAGLPAITTAVCCAGPDGLPIGIGTVHTWEFNKPVIGPIVHVVNLAGSYLDITGTTTTGDDITLSAVQKNDALELDGERINDVNERDFVGGCHLNGSVVNPMLQPVGGCGSIQLLGGVIQDFTMTNLLADVGPNSGDGWTWAVSFPTAPLTKEFDPSPIFVGETSTLTFTIENPDNPGQIPLSPLDFTDVLPDDVTLANGSVSTAGCGSPTVGAPGGSPLEEGGSEIEATNISVALGGTCTITINVTSDTPGTYVNDNDNLSTEIANLIPNADTTLVVLPLTDLEVQKSGPGRVDRGGPITWEMEVTNNGPSPSSGSTLTDEIPDGVTDASSPTPGCQVAGGILECAVGALDVGESTTVLLRGRAPREPRTCVRNAAEIEGNEDDPVDENNQDSVRTCTLKPRIRITKKASKDVVRPGETLSYRIQVRNRGKASAFNLRVCDKPKRHLEIISAPGADTVSSRKACWKIKRLKPRGKKTFRVISRVAMDAPASDCQSGAGGASNVATVNGKDGRDKDEECVAVKPASSACRTTRAAATDSGVQGAVRNALRC